MNQTDNMASSFEVNNPFPGTEVFMDDSAMFGESCFFDAGGIFEENEILKENPMLGSGSDQMITQFELRPPGTNFCDEPNSFHAEKKGCDSFSENLEKIVRDTAKYDFEILNHDSAKHVVVDGRLFTKRLHDVNIEVVGVEPGCYVKASMQYTAGAHCSKPVLACKNHCDEEDDGQTTMFFIPELNHDYWMNEDGHPNIKIPLSSGNTFTMIFRCLNSCHTRYGKDQELILRLYNSYGHLLHKKKISVRVCENVNRDAAVRKGKRVHKHASKEGKRKKIKSEKTETAEEFMKICITIPSSDLEHFKFISSKCGWKFELPGGGVNSTFFA